MLYPSTNRLLDALSPESQQRLLLSCKRVELPVGAVLSEAHGLPAYAYFLESGFASIVITERDAGSAEVGVIAREGLVSYWALMGNAGPASRCFMQAKGTGYRISVERLRGAFRESEEIRSRILEFAQEQVVASTYLAACSKLHEAEARLARWLLMVQDRLREDVMPLTQEFLADMLGTRRMTVTTAAGALQQSGLIEYRRGKVSVLDRAGLEQAACACYGHLRALDEALYR